MITLIFATFLISDPWFKPRIPEPYLGFGFSLNKQHILIGDSVSGAISERKTTYKTVASLGIPFQFNEFEIFGSRTMRLILLPEFLLGIDVWGASMGVGPEMYLPLSDYQIPNGWFWGVQVGPFYSNISDPTVISNKTTTALVTNLYFGPQFDFGNACSLKLQVNPKFYFGRMAPGLVQSEWSDVIGAALFFNAQLRF